MDKQDNELFELCKEVYELTGWTEEKERIPVDIGSAPLYTSDYILEKLEKLDGNTELSTVNEKWLAAFTNFTNSVRKVAYKDTPLKALLKLTIALYEAGEL